MPIGATHPMHSSKGHIVRVWWNDGNYDIAYSNFYNLMREEANPVSYRGRSKIVQLPRIYYWRGAVVVYNSCDFIYTKGENSIYAKSENSENMMLTPCRLIEIQHSNKKALDSLVSRLITEIETDTNATFHRETVIGELERAERKKSQKSL